MSRSDGTSHQQEVARRILSLKERRESDAAFARRIGLSPQLISNYRSGRHGASLDAVIQTIQRSDVDPGWLLTGEGQKRRRKDDGADPVGRALSEVIDSVDDVLEELEARFGLVPGRRRGVGGLGEGLR